MGGGLDVACFVGQQSIGIERQTRLHGLLEADDRLLLGFLPIGTRQLDGDLDEVKRAAVGVKVFPERLIVATGSLRGLSSGSCSKSRSG